MYQRKDLNMSKANDNGARGASMNDTGDYDVIDSNEPNANKTADKPSKRAGSNAKRNEAARKAITEALFQLMESKCFSSISVCDIVDTAGVARMSYYRNFSSKEQIIEAYIDKLHDDLLANDTEPAASEQSLRGLLDEETLTNGFSRSLQHMRHEQKKILTLVNAGFATTLQQMMDSYLEARLGDMPASSIERYELYFASGALLNVLVKWLEQKTKEPPEEMAAFCAKLLREGLRQR